jgi:hypothetical protein
MRDKELENTMRSLEESKRMRGIQLKAAKLFGVKWGSYVRERKHTAPEVANQSVVLVKDGKPITVREGMDEEMKVDVELWPKEEAKRVKKLLYQRDFKKGRRESSGKPTECFLYSDGTITLKTDTYTGLVTRAILPLGEVERLRKERYKMGVVVGNREEES